jgi:hypothetical protein
MTQCSYEGCRGPAMKGRRRCWAHSMDPATIRHRAQARKKLQARAWVKNARYRLAKFTTQELMTELAVRRQEHEDHVVGTRCGV